MTNKPEVVRMVVPGMQIVGEDITMALMEGLLSEPDACLAAMNMRSAALRSLGECMRQRENKK